jgi:hypothetical protein
MIKACDDDYVMPVPLQHQHIVITTYCMMDVYVHLYDNHHHQQQNHHDIVITSHKYDDLYLQ